MIEIIHEIGKRDTQEDTFVTYEASTDVIDSEQGARDFLNNLHTQFLEITKEHESSGSTAISTVFLPQENKIIWSNLGDSQATLFVYRGSHQTIESRRLNDLHKPPEGKRIFGLSVSRAYGDKNHQSLEAFSQDLEIGELDLNTLELKEGDRAFFMTSCDGFFERKLTEKSYHESIKNSLSEDNSSVSDVIDAIYNFVQGISEDNLTATMIELTDLKMKEKNAVVSQVFDGHGGEETSMQLLKTIQALLEGKEGISEMQSSDDYGVTASSDISREESSNAEHDGRDVDVIDLESVLYNLHNFDTGEAGEPNKPTAPVVEDKKATTPVNTSNVLWNTCKLIGIAFSAYAMHYSHGANKWLSMAATATFCLSAERLINSNGHRNISIFTNLQSSFLCTPAECIMKTAGFTNPFFEFINQYKIIPATQPLLTAATLMICEKLFSHPIVVPPQFIGIAAEFIKPVIISPLSPELVVKTLVSSWAVLATYAGAQQMNR